MARGGYRQPRDPAPVSGPGKYSKRTDGQVSADLPDAAYGEQRDFQAAQSGAPMSGPPPATTGGPAAGPATAGPPVEVVPFGAPSQRPDEPVTAGAERGPGPGLDSLGLRSQGQQITAEDVAAIRQFLPYLEWLSSLDSSSASTRALVRAVRSRIVT